MKKKLLFIIILLSFILPMAIAFASATDYIPPEINYPEIPGAETPQSFTLKIHEFIDTNGASGYSPDLAFPLYVQYFYNFSLIVAGLVAFFALIYGGFSYMTSAARPAKMADAKSQILAGFLGLIILLSSYLALAAINPQLAIFKLPNIATTTVPITKFVPAPTGPVYYTYQEIPIGTLINSERQYGATTTAYSQYEGALYSERMNRIMVIASITKRVSEKLNEFSQNLDADNSSTLISNCLCENTNLIDTIGCTGSCDAYSTGNCKCEGKPNQFGDPCENYRPSIQTQQRRLEIFATAFEIFLKESDISYNNGSYGTLDEFIDYLENPINVGKPDYVAFSFLDTDIKNLITKMRNVENEYEGFEENLKDLKVQIDKLKKAERAVTVCQNQAQSYNNFQIFKADLGESREATTTKLFSDIEIGEDPATFYCKVP